MTRLLSFRECEWLEPYFVVLGNLFPKARREVYFGPFTAEAGSEERAIVYAPRTPTFAALQPTHVTSSFPDQCLCQRHSWRATLPG